MPLLTMVVICSRLTGFFTVLLVNAVWELGAPVCCVGQTKTGVLCPSYPVLVSCSVLTAVHRRGFLKSTASLWANSSSPVGTSVIKASPSSWGRSRGTPRCGSALHLQSYSIATGGMDLVSAFGLLQRPYVPSSAERCAASGASISQNWLKPRTNRVSWGWTLFPLHLEQNECMLALHKWHMHSN